MKINQHFCLSKHFFFSAVFWIPLGWVFGQCTPKSSQISSSGEAIRILTVGGGESHDFEQWFKDADSETLSGKGLAEVKYTKNTDSILYYLPEADVLYLTNNQPIQDAETRQAIFDFADSGKGLILGHASLWYNWEDWPEFNQQIVSGGSRGHDKYGSFEVKITDTDHPVTQGVDQKFSLKDELYYFKVDEKGPGIEILATARSRKGDIFPSVFVIKHPKTRIVGLALGHDGESHYLEAYQTILRNAVEWVANDEID